MSEAANDIEEMIKHHKITYE